MRRVFTLLVAMLALCACATTGEKRFPTSVDYPASTMARVTLRAAVPEGWALSAMTTPNADALWKLVVITGTPSLSEYWAPLLAATPSNLQIIVADRPGFNASQPPAAVTNIATQARFICVARAIQCKPAGDCDGAIQ